MQVANNEGGSREALLTQKEREYLQSDKVIPENVLEKLRVKLNRRLLVAVEDLKLIIRTPHLETWRAFHNAKMDNVELEVLALMAELKSAKVQPAYIYPVKFFGKRDKRKYWLDINSPTKLRNERIFDPAFALRNVRDETAASDLIAPLVARVIPFFTVDALTLEQIKINYRSGKVYEPDAARLVDSVPELKALREQIEKEVTG